MGKVINFINNLGKNASSLFKNTYT